MFCPNCGSQTEDGARFCASCGAVIADAPAAEQTDGAAPTRPTPNIQLCEDGVYRWFYPFDMRKNPTVLFTVWNVIAIAFGMTYLFVLLINVIGDSLYGMEGFLELTKVFAILLAVFLVIGFAAYLILAKRFGWRYLVVFEMDGDGVVHRQMKSQFEQAQGLALLALLAAPNATTTGAALLAMTRDRTTSRFASVRTVKVSRRYHTIKLNERLMHNQVYAAPEDFDFVLDHILRHIPDTTKVKGR